MDKERKPEAGRAGSESPAEAKVAQGSGASPLAPPAPVIYDWNREFFRGGIHGQLMLQRCTRCHRLIYYPRILCPHCLCEEYQWVAVTGRGTIYSYSVVWRPLHAAFESQVPIILVIVDLEEQVQMVSTLVQCPVEQATIGMPVTVVFHAISPEVALPKFKPSEA